MNPLDQVFELYRRGLWVVPIDPSSRVPLVAWSHVDDHGHPDGPRFRGGFVVGCDLPYSTWLFAWWRQWPDAGAAVLCGRSRLAVLDVDLRHDGKASLERLCADLELPVTLTMRTRGGGCHLYFRTSKLVRSKAGVLGPGLDIKSYRGLVTAPPTSGYSILIDSPIAPAPAALVNLCPKPFYGGNFGTLRRAELSYDTDDAQSLIGCVIGRIKDSAPGTRHDTLYGQARHLFKRIGDPRVDTILLAAAREIGLPTDEAVRTIDDARRKARRGQHRTVSLG
jgi:Bifunctional DNA primase/polymerase, N-terminal